MKKSTIIIILALIILLGGFFRFYHLDRQSYWMDEGYTINAVISAAQNGYADGSSILDSGGKYFCPLYCYPTQIISRAIGQNAFAYRSLAAIFGVLFILLAFFTTKIIFKNNPAALLTAFFVSFSYFQIAWSREARWYTMLEVFFWLALFFFYLFLNSCHPERLAKDLHLPKTKKYLYLAISIFFTILSIITHKIAYLLPLIMLAWYALSFRPERSGVEESLKLFKKIILAIVSAAVILAFAEYALGLHFIAHAFKNVSFHYNLPYYLSFYLRNYWLLIALAIYGYFSASDVIPAQAGIQSIKRKMLILALPFVIYLIFLSFLTNIVHYRYLFHTTLYIYMLSAVAICHFRAGGNQVNSPLGRGGRRLGWVSTALPLLLIAIFFLSGEGVLIPKNFYNLESDNPSTLNRPYYAYTPQPNFNEAYAVIKNNLKPDEIVISSHPHFNKIFLNQPGYWLRYDYLGMENTPNTLFLLSRAPGEESALDSLSSRAPREGSVPYYKEYYVGAEVINNLAELKTLTKSKHGYIVFDYMSIDSRINPQIINYIQTNLKQIFYNKINSYSQIWVYKF